uniref:Uncharacterized protein n=1 Tax=Anguilla anguilla TaxID=7936 RepID=A0A0E9RM97_ANGAN
MHTPDRLRCQYRYSWCCMVSVLLPCFSM